jgi:DNA-binding IclR family transcriptional regulator
LGKIKLVKALAEEDRMMTIYSLHKKTHLKREDIKRNLGDLVEIEWVIEEKLANVLYRLNRQNENVQHLLTFFKNVEYINYA